MQSLKDATDKDKARESDTTTGLVAAYSRAHQALRERTIRATPAFIVNNMTNFVAGAHVAAEIMMLKSGHLKFHQSNPKGIKWLNTKNALGEARVNPIVDYPNNIWRALRGFKNGETSAERAAAVNGKDPNRWLIRSTASGFSAWILGTVTPEKKDNQKDTEQDIELYERSKAGYFAQRGKEALMLFNPATKRQQIGLGVTLSGIFSTISGMNMVSKQGSGFKAFSRSAGGACTTLAGLGLWFSITDQKAWERFGLGIAGRLPFIPFSIHKMYKENGHWEYYSGAMGVFQSAALFSSFLGGVRKNPDGTITEIKTKRDEGGHIKVTEDRASKALRAQQAEPDKEEEKPLIPSNVVTEINPAKETARGRAAMIA